MFKDAIARHCRHLAISASAALAGAATSQAAEISPDLIAKAKQEGQVTYYTDLIVDQIVRPLIKSFATYAPGVQVKYVRADGLALVLRITNEGRASRVQSDVWCMVDGVQSLGNKH